MGDGALPFDGLTVPSKVEGYLDHFEQPAGEGLFASLPDPMSVAVKLWIPKAWGMAARLRYGRGPGSCGLASKKSG